MQSTASRTARGVAIRRAAHQLLDHPPVFEDPLALAILDKETAQLLETDLSRFENSPNLRAFVAARSRFAEEELASAFHRGVRQFVLLGAGLDTFAYRNPFGDSGVRIFEVDHPATQAWKREQLAEAGITEPPLLRFVPLDFESRSLAEALQEFGFLARQPAFFSWLGVVPYLTLEAAQSTLAFIGALPPGTGVVFDYGISPASLTPAKRRPSMHWPREWRARASRSVCSLSPSELAGMLSGLGFDHIEDLDAAEIDRRFFRDRTDGLRVGGLAHLVSATLRGTA